MDWIYDECPKAIGFYAISYCWDNREGIFPSADWWDGSSWSAGYPIIAYAGPFKTYNLANEWAIRHDIEIKRDDDYDGC